MRKTASKIFAAAACVCAFQTLAAATASDAASSMKSPGETATRSSAKVSAELPDHPLAPAEFRRPDGYQPRLYELNLRQISEKYGAKTIERGRAEYARVSAVNESGKWKADGKSIDAHKCPEWFVDAKLGIFIDWGLWSIASWAPKRENGAMYPDWYELRMYSDFTPDSHFYGYRSYHVKNWGADFERDHFIPLFKAEKFDAKELMEVFAKAGAKYIVPFNKHHSGFCLWDCSYTLRDTVDMGPRRDIVREIVDACAAQNLKFGFYMSLTEWDYPVVGKDGKMRNFSWGKTLDYSPDMEYKASGKIAVEDYVKEYLVPQSVEFIDKYSPDILWFDGEWRVSATELGGYDIAAYFYNVNEGKKQVAVNDRYGEGTPREVAHKGGKKLKKLLRAIRGDFYTDEFGDTADCIDPAKYHPWEACRGISQSYGNNWQDNESNVLTSSEFISMFADTVARGGNLLLLVNLDGQGAIPEIQKKRLLDIGKWLSKYGRAIYSTRIIEPFATEEIAYTRSKDGRTAYAIVKKPKSEMKLAIAPKKGSEIVEIATGEKIGWTESDGGAVIKLPENLAESELPFALEIALK